MQQATIREAVCVFNNQQQLDAAINELETTAFPRQDISVLASDKKLEEAYGTANIHIRKLEDSADAPRDISMRPEEKTIMGTAFVGVCAYVAGCAAAILSKEGTIAALLTFIAAGSILGAGIGMIIVYLIGRHLYKDSQHKIRKGGLVLWVRTPAPDKEDVAQKIMRKHGGRDVHIHNLA